MAFRNGGAVATVDVTFAGSLVLTGMLIEWAVATPPGGFLLCDGTTVSRATYADLFALWGTTFGAGDGSTTFGLPDYRGRVSVHPDGGAGRLSAAGAVGATGGDVAFLNEELARILTSSGSIGEALKVSQAAQARGEITAAQARLIANSILQAASPSRNALVTSP